MNNMSGQLNMLNSGRIKYIDYTKGFAILLMVLGHVEICNEYMFNWIYSFHMPIFFVVCGMLMFYREQIGKVSWRKIVKRRLYQLGVPYITGSLLLVIYFLLMESLSHVPLKTLDYVQQCVFLWGVSVMWFIPCYMVAEVCLAAIVSSSEKWIFILLILLTILYVLIDSKIVTSMHFLNVARMALGCVIGWMGYRLAKYNIIKRCSLIMSMCLIIVGTFLSQIEGYSSMGEFNLGNPMLYFITFVTMSLGFLSLFWNFEYKESLGFPKGLGQFLSYWGRNSIIVLVTHNLILEVFRLLDYKLFNLAIRDAGLIGSIPLTVLILLLEIPIIYLANHQLAFLFGKKHA